MSEMESSDVSNDSTAISEGSGDMKILATWKQRLVEHISNKAYRRCRSGPW